MSDEMLINNMANNRGDYLADRRAEHLREDFDKLRGRIEDHPTMSESKKERLLDRLDAHEDLLVEEETNGNENQVGLEDPGDQTFDCYNVIRKEFNQALEGYRDIADEIPDVADVGQPESLEGTIDPDAVDAIGEVDPTELDPPPASDKTDAPGETEEAKDADGGDGGNSIGSLEFDGMSVDGMLNTLNDDPQAVMDHIQGLDEEDKQMAMQMLQQRLQQINQMFSMLSNLAKTQHDTAKAAINNMRV